jgi:RIO kinase 2
MAKLVGEREFKIMVALREAGARVPEPIAWNRHAVVQEYVPGFELYRIRGLDVEEAQKLLGDVMDSVRIAYEKVGIVHGDLSEYNILVTESLEAFIIDWPQYVYREQEGAEELLERDIGYVVSFFNRRFGLREDPEYWLEYVRGGAESTGEKP